jgi:sortase B
MKWQIFSVYVYRSGDDTLQIAFNNDEEYARYLDMIISRSIYKTGVDVTTDDRILTLMTCSYEYNNARLVIHAKRV